MALDSGKKIYAGLALLDKIQIDRDKVCILQESELSDEVVSPNKKRNRYSGNISHGIGRKLR